MSENKPLSEAVERLDTDFYLYNGPIMRSAVLGVIESVNAAKTREQATLLLVTNGGDPDAAFKIARYFQLRYSHFTVLIAGVCKSAGTLLAIGANELAFTPFGELGPLDIQMTKVDRFEQMQSGLVITDALNTLEERAMELVFKTTAGLVEQNQGMVSFTAATQVAMESMKAIYSPVLARIDPEEIGTRSRAMRIAQDYGKRLQAASKNLNVDTLRLLAETYSSHSFVIDQIEAESLFRNVRSATDVEKAVVAELRQFARYQQGGEIQFHALHTKQDQDGSGDPDDRTDGERDSPGDGGNFAGADEAPVVEADEQGAGELPGSNLEPETIS